MLGALVVFYLFLGGCGASVLFVASLWSLLFHATAQRTQRQTDAFDRLKAACFVVGFAMLSLAALCLLLDLGRPDRAYLLFVRPTFSILSFGSFSLLACLVVGGFLVAANVLYLPFVHAPARKAAEVACLAASACVVAYTGVYVGWVQAVPLWHNAAVPVLFALSSLSSGLSVVFVAMPFVRDMRLLEGWTLALHRAHLAALALEVAALVAFLALAFANPFAGESLAVLVGADGMGAWFVVGFAGLGLLVPIVVEAAIAVSRRVVRLPPVDVLCILGGLILRFCVVWSGMH